MIKNVITVEKSKDGKRTYATDLKGNPMFARTETLNINLKAGCYVNVVEQLQTKTRNEAGELVDLPIEEQRKNLIITAVFADKAAAIAANAEESLFEVETKAFVKAEKENIIKTYKLEGVKAEDLVG